MARRDECRDAAGAAHKGNPMTEPFIVRTLAAWAIVLLLSQIIAPILWPEVAP